MNTDVMMEKRVLSFLREHHMAGSGNHVIAGVSGGADSVCLLLLLKKLTSELGFRLTAVHVEHGIRGEESLRDAEFVERLCAREEIPFMLRRVDAEGCAAADGLTLEEAARRLRYACFCDAARELGADRIAVAHHAGDCAETMLFHLSRGTGLRGLCGIVPVRRIVPADFGSRAKGEMTLIRPLLSITRREVEQYLAERGQDYCTDSSNADTSYARNRIRHHILPEFSRLNARAVEHMARTAGYLEDVCAYLEEAAWEEGRQGITVSRENGAEAFHVREEHFLRMPPVLQRIFLHRVLEMAAGSRKDITERNIEDLRALFDRQTGKVLDLPYGLRAAKGYGEVRIEAAGNRFDVSVAPSATSYGEVRIEAAGDRRYQERKTEKTERDVPGRGTRADEARKNGLRKRGASTDGGEPRINLELAVPGETILPDGTRIRTEIVKFDKNFKKIPHKTYTKWFDYDKINNAVLLRNRLPGDYFQVNAFGGHKKLKDYLIDEKVPAAERKEILLLADGSHILWVVGYRVSEAFKVTQGTERVLEVRMDGGAGRE